MFTKRECSLIFSSLKKSSFFKSMILLNFPIRWSSNILNLFNISMILKNGLFDDFNLMLVSSLHLSHTLPKIYNWILRNLANWKGNPRLKGDIYETSFSSISQTVYFTKIFFLSCQVLMSLTLTLSDTNYFWKFKNMEKLYDVNVQ